jgi:hypothetical protein
MVQPKKVRTCVVLSGSVLLLATSLSTYAATPCFDVSEKWEAGTVGKRYDKEYKCPGGKQITQHEFHEKHGDRNDGSCKWIPSGTANGHYSISGDTMKVHAWTDICTWYEFNAKAWTD